MNNFTTTGTTTEARLASVDAELALAKDAICRIKKNLAPFESEARVARLRLRLFKLGRWLRGPSKSYGLWKVGLLLVATATTAVLCFVFADVVLNPVSAAIWASAIGAACIAGVLAIALYNPRDAVLTEWIVEAEINSRIAEARLSNQRVADGLEHAEGQLKLLMDEGCKLLHLLREEIAAGMQTRRSLLQRNWRAMRDDEWEEYLAQVFAALGANARRIGGAGDQGVDLIVEFGAKRIAVQAKGYYHAVNNKAVQEAFTGMHHHGCNLCAVITNSRFTKGAHEVATSTGCILIGEREFPDLVIGNLALFGREL